MLFNFCKYKYLKPEFKIVYKMSTETQYSAPSSQCLQHAVKIANRIESFTRTFG